MSAKKSSYPASLKIDYQKKHDRLSSFFRIVWAVPILVIIGIISSPGRETYTGGHGGQATASGTGIAGGLFVATALLILFRQKYPRWWYDFNLELNRFSTRVGAYLFLLTDKYPSTDEQQSVHLEVMYPDVKRDLNRWLPLVKWLLAFPHYIVLFVLFIAAFLATVLAWFSILFTGNYPKSLFDFVVGVGRWSLRVTAYAFLLTTDEYPPFSLD